MCFYEREWNFFVQRCKWVDPNSRKYQKMGQFVGNFKKSTSNHFLKINRNFTKKPLKFNARSQYI